MSKESKDDNFTPESSPLGKSPMEKERATIGPSISIKGELSGEEDVVIQGRVEGKISLDLQQDNASVASSLRKGKKARFFRLLEKNATPSSQTLLPSPAPSQRGAALSMGARLERERDEPPK